MHAMPQSDFAEFLPGLRRRWQQEQTARRQMRAAALKHAAEAAQILRERYQARRVIVFGSAARDGVFDDRSDIDLAVEGLDPADFFKAWTEILRGSPCEIDLVDLAKCPPSLRDNIEREGLQL